MKRCDLLIGLALTALLPAQDLVPKAAPETRPVLIRGAVIHTVTHGTILGGQLWFQDGVIRGVVAAGEAPGLPAGVEPLVIDGTDLHVYPGLIAARTALGLQEMGMVRQSVDLSEVGELTPEAMAMVAINPDAAALPVTRSNGVLAAAVFPAGGLLPGRVAVIQLDGWSNDDLAVSADAGLVIAWPAMPSGEPHGRRGRQSGPDAATAARLARQRLDDAFAAAAGWVGAISADAKVGIDLRWQAMAPAVRGEKPVFMLANDAEQIESAVIWAASRHLRAVIVGGEGSLACADLLVRHQVPVIVDGTHRLPRSDDSPYSEPFELPARLHEAGVRFCLASGEQFYNERNLPYAAATAVAFGLDRQTALESITSAAADILGVGARLGSIEVGKDATLFLADGSPLELTTRIDRAFVRGRQIDLRNKQTELARKYREKYRQLGKPR